MKWDPCFPRCVLKVFQKRWFFNGVVWLVLVRFVPVLLLVVYKAVLCTPISYITAFPATYIVPKALVTFLCADQFQMERVGCCDWKISKNFHCNCNRINSIIVIHQNLHRKPLNKCVSHFISVGCKGRLLGIHISFIYYIYIYSYIHIFLYDDPVYLTVLKIARRSFFWNKRSMALFQMSFLLIAEICWAVFR